MRSVSPNSMADLCGSAFEATVGVNVVSLQSARFSSMEAFPRLQDMPLVPRARY